MCAIFQAVCTLKSTYITFRCFLRLDLSSHSVSKAVLKLQFTSAYLCRYTGLVNFTHIKMDIPDNTKELRVINHDTFAVNFYYYRLTSPVN